MLFLSMPCLLRLHVQFQQALGQQFLGSDHNQFFDVISTYFNYDIKIDYDALTTAEPRTVGLKPNKIGHVDRVIIRLFILFVPRMFL